MELAEVFSDKANKLITVHQTQRFNRYPAACASEGKAAEYPTETELCPAHIPATDDRRVPAPFGALGTAGHF